MIIYGRNSVKEYLFNNPSNISCVYIHEGTKKPLLEEIKRLCDRSHVKLSSVSDSDISKLCKSTKHQGLAAEVKDFQYTDFDEYIKAGKEDDSNKIVLVLDHIEDPHNLGAVIRSVNVLGAHAVVIPKDRSADVTPGVVKASAGAVNYVPVIREVNLSRVVDKLKQSGFWIVGADQNATMDIHTEDFSGRDISIIMGSEGKGLGSGLKKQCDYLVKIPQYGDVSSLNVSVASGIMIYQIKLNQR